METASHAGFKRIHPMAATQNEEGNGPAKKEALKRLCHPFRISQGNGSTSFRSIPRLLLSWFFLSGGRSSSN